MDRFEEEFAVFEAPDGGTINVKRSLLPEGSREGAVFESKDGKWIFNAEKTSERKKIIENKFNSLWK